MRHSIIVAGLVAAFLSAPVFAVELKIAVVDIQGALGASDITKKAVDKLQGELKIPFERMAQLKAEVEALQARDQKEGAVMTPKDREALQKQASSKVQEFQNLGQMAQKRKQELESELVQRLLPKIQVIIDEMQKANKYDLILRRENTVGTVDPSLDLTKKVTEKLNAIK